MILVSTHVSAGITSQLVITTELHISINITIEQLRQ